MTRHFPIYVPPNGPPSHRPDPAIYAQMGETNIFAMIEDLYSELEKSSIRSMFPEDMHAAAQKSASFFVFLLGGPPLYQERHGAPMMRKRHMEFDIDETARQIWLDCFHKVLEHPEKYHFPPEHLQQFWEFLEKFSAWMVNKKD